MKGFLHYRGDNVRLWGAAFSEALGRDYVATIGADETIYIWRLLDHHYTKELRFRVALSPGLTRKLHVRAERNRVMATFDDINEAVSWMKFMTAMEGW